MNPTREQLLEVVWARGELTHLLWPQQRQIYDTVRSLPRNVQTIVFLCARQFGKSVLGCLLAIEDCLRNPDVVVMIIGPTIKQARAIVRPRIKLLTKGAPAGMIREVKTEDTWYFSNGSELKLGGFDTNSTAERGKTLYRCYLEEIGVDSDPDKYNDFLRSDLGPALTHSKHAQIVYLTTPPKIPDHPFLLETVPEAQKYGAYFEFTIHDNAQLSPEQYAQCVKLAGGEHTTEFKREYLVQVVRDTGLVLAPEFTEASHVCEFDLPQHYYAWISGDFGGVRDRHAFHLMAYDFVRAKVLVLDERDFPPETGTAEIVASLKQMEQGHPVKSRWVDAPGQLQVDLMAPPLSYACVLPRKDELEATVNQVRLALTRGEIEIHPRCKMLIMTLRSGTFNETRTDLARTSTLGHMDHFMSLAYGLRHTNRANPFPLHDGKSPYTHYIPPTSPTTARNAQAFKSLFTRA